MARSKRIGQRGRYGTTSGFRVKTDPLLLGVVSKSRPSIPKGGFFFKTLRPGLPAVVKRSYSFRNSLLSSMWLSKPREALVNVHRDIVCAKRKIRREVLMSMDVAGRKGRGGSRRYTSDSRVRC